LRNHLLALDGGEELPNGNRRKPGPLPGPKYMLKGINEPQILERPQDRRWFDFNRACHELEGCNQMIEEGGEKMNRLNEELRKAKSNLAKKESEKQNVDQVLEEKRLAVERLQERLKDVQEAQGDAQRRTQAQATEDGLR
jgi:chromosome segregation ATPase